MKKGLIASLILFVTLPAWASEDKHFKAQKPNSYAQAQTFLTDGKSQLASLLADGQVSLEEMGKIHQLTYQLENALEYMEQELDQIQEVLERVHQGSEKGTNEQVFQDSTQFLEASNVLH